MLFWHFKRRIETRLSSAPYAHGILGILNVSMSHERLKCLSNASIQRRRLRHIGRNLVVRRLHINGISNRRMASQHFGT